MPKILGDKIGGKMNELEIFEIAERNEKYANAHYDEFEQKYRNKFLAIKDQKILIVKEDGEELLNILEKEGIDINTVFITSIPPKGVASIL